MMPPKSKPDDEAAASAETPDTPPAGEPGTEAVAEVTDETKDEETADAAEPPPPGERVTADEARARDAAARGPGAPAPLVVEPVAEPGPEPEPEPEPEVVVELEPDIQADPEAASAAPFVDEASAELDLGPQADPQAAPAIPGLRGIPAEHVDAIAKIGEQRYGLYLFPKQGYCTQAGGPFVAEAVVDDLVGHGLAWRDPSGGHAGSVKLTDAGRIADAALHPQLADAD